MPRSAMSMTSTRSTIPAPPPNGVSSTCPPLSGVCSRGFSARSSWPPPSALATWRCERNDSNHSGKRVTTSSCTSAGLARRRRRGLAKERHVDVDHLRHHVDTPDGVAHERDEEGLVLVVAGHLERLARWQRHEPRDVPELARAVDDAAALEVLGPPLILLERRRGRTRDEQRGPAQRARGVAVGHAVEAHDRALVGPGAADDLGFAVAGADDHADLQERRTRVEDVEGAGETVRAAAAAAGEAAP